MRIALARYQTTLIQIKQYLGVDRPWEETMPPFEQSTGAERIYDGTAEVVSTELVGRVLGESRIHPCNQYESIPYGGSYSCQCQ